MYYNCAGNGAMDSCTALLAPLAANQQVPNPVTRFPVDNNGVIVELPAVPSTGAPSANGVLVFGIGTQANNGLGKAQVFTTDGAGNFSTVFNGATFPASFFDSGSNSLFFAANGIPTCADATGFFCPASPVSLSALLEGANGTNATLDFSVANTDTLTDSGNFAFNDQGGSAGAFFPNGTTFDWGLPAFYGRNIFTAIAGASTPGGAGPYYAF